MFQDGDTARIVRWKTESDNATSISFAIERRPKNTIEFLPGIVVTLTSGRSSGDSYYKLGALGKYSKIAIATQRHTEDLEGFPRSETGNEGIYLIRATVPGTYGENVSKCSASPQGMSAGNRRELSESLLTSLMDALEKLRDSLVHELKGKEGDELLKRADRLMKVQCLAEFAGEAVRHRVVSSMGEFWELGFTRRTTIK